MAFQVTIAGAEDIVRQQLVTQVVVERALYNHSRAHVEMRWHEHDRYAARAAAALAARLLQCRLDVFWRDNDLAEQVPCFHGYVEQIHTRRDASHSYLMIEGVAFSQRTDLIPRHRAFQATNLLAIAQHVAATEPLFRIDQAGDLNAIPIVLSLQHGETDFAYLQRMCHAHAVPFAIDDLTGNVHLGARAKDPGKSFPDADFGWDSVTFSGGLQALTQTASGGSGPTGLAREAMASWNGGLNRKAADYHGTPEHGPKQTAVHGTMANVDTSGYALALHGMVLPFAPGHAVGFEGGQHLIRSSRIVGEMDTANVRQSFGLQAQPLPVGSQPDIPEWHSRALWGWVTDNEHDPLQQGRIQVEFDWEELDPQPSSERAWLHTLTPYGGGTDAGKKVSAYAGFYSLPEVGDRVLVEFLGTWDSEAVVIGVVRHNSQKMPLNAKHTKRWRTPSGNEITMTTRGGDDVTRIKTRDNLILEAHNSGGSQHVSLVCHSSEADSLHIFIGEGGNKVELRGSNDMLIYAQNHLHIQAKKITMLAQDGDVAGMSTADENISLQAKKNVMAKAETESIGMSAKKDLVGGTVEGNVGWFAKKNLTLDAADEQATLHGKGGVGINSEKTVVQRAPSIHLNPDS